MEHLNPVPSSAEALRSTPAGASVAVLTAEGLDRLLDYRAPGGRRARRATSSRCRSGRGACSGWSGATARADVAEEKLRDVARVLDAPPLAAAMREFLARAADYTLTPLPIDAAARDARARARRAALGAAAAAADRARSPTG